MACAPPCTRQTAVGASPGFFWLEPDVPPRPAPNRSGVCRTPGCQLPIFHIGNCGGAPVPPGLPSGNLRNAHASDVSQTAGEGAQDEEKAHEAVIRNEQGKFETIHEPRNFYEAMNSPYQKEWKQAMREELDAHKTNKTWYLDQIANMPAGVKMVGSTWVFKIKRNADGTVARFKARLCAQGFSQEHGLHYDVTFSNTITRDTLRMLLATAARLGLRLTAADIKTAFLNGVIEEGLVVGMRQPPGFEKEGEFFALCD